MVNMLIKMATLKIISHIITLFKYEFNTCIWYFRDSSNKSIFSKISYIFELLILISGFYPMPEPNF